MNKIASISKKKVEYFEAFITKTRLLPSSKTVYVALSGGADSMFLLNLCWLLREKGKIKNLVALHINHGTRKESSVEENFLKKYTQHLDIPIYIKRLKLNLKQSNFENEARKERYHFFYSHVKKDQVLFLGHNIDDSFEWSLLNLFKTTTLQTRLGIPLKRKIIARPLFCFSAAQIRSEMKRRKLPYFEDKSNKNTRYERNFLRAEVLSKVKARFPSALKNYVAASNSLAKSWNLSLFETPAATQVFHFKGGSILKAGRGDQFFCEEKIKECLFLYSKSERGTLREQIKKLKEAVSSKKWGPLTFSGGVDIHIRPGFLYVGPKGEPFVHDLDTLMEEKLKTITAQIPNDSYSLHKESQSLFFNNVFPYSFSLSPLAEKKIRPSLRKIDPLFPLTSSFALKNHIWFYYSFALQGQKNYTKLTQLLCTFP